ncbi:MAG: CPBP family intramembrane metalloprotease [Fimbriimonadaceae bacterium]|nr:MAG: CPBP family intramembrane metalloprotease [Fimbriimonadaceae bacterium]
MEPPPIVDLNKERRLEILAVLAMLVVPGIVESLLSFAYSIKMSPMISNTNVLTRSVCTLAILWLLLRRSPWSLADHGLGKLIPKYFWQAAILVVLMFVAYYVYGDFYWAVHSVFPQVEFQPWLNTQLFQQSKGLAVLILVPAMIANSFVEEIAIRGILQTHLVHFTRSVGAGILVSTLAFTSYHLYQGIFPLIDIFVLGIIFAWSRIQFRSLWPAIIAHTVYNILLLTM